MRNAIARIIVDESPNFHNAAVDYLWKKEDTMLIALQIADRIINVYQTRLNNWVQVQGWRVYDPTSESQESRFRPATIDDLVAGNAIRMLKYE